LMLTLSHFISGQLANRSGKRKHHDKTPLLILCHAAGEDAQRGQMSHVHATTIF